MKQVMRYLCHTRSIGIEHNGSTQPNLHGYSDSDWAEDRETRRSTSGNVFLVAGGAVSWESKRQVTVTTTSTEAEFMAAAFAAKETVWLRQLLRDLERHYIDPDERNVLPATVMYGDNTGKRLGPKP